MSIPNLTEKIKEKREVLLHIAIIAFVAISAFYIGYVAHAETTKIAPSVIIHCPAEAYFDGGIGSADRSGVVLPGAQFGSFVASRNGTRYYPTSCSGANRIHEVNKVWFETEQEAQNAGFTRATTCLWE